jgi:hypothetical protein
MNEMVFLGGCPLINNEGIYLDGHRVIRFGMSGVGLGDVGDLLAFRQEWEPFIQAHLELWRDLNQRFENAAEIQWCPPGIFTNEQIKNLEYWKASWCAALALTRKMVSTTDPDGILPRWNAWQNKSSAEILTGAGPMLKWHQDVVLNVGGPDKDRLLSIAKQWEIPVQLPPLPTFGAQQEIISRIQGAYIATKGILQIIGYGYGESLATAADVAQATAQGLKDTAADLPKTARWVGIAAAMTAVLVGGALIVYYVPRKQPKAA